MDNNGNSGNKRRPKISFKLFSDSTTSMEVSVWANTYRSQSGDEFTQYSMTMSRSYKDQEGTWNNGGSYRPHDLPVLTLLIEKAHAWALEKRMIVKGNDDGTANAEAAASVPRREMAAAANGKASKPQEDTSDPESDIPF